MAAQPLPWQPVPVLDNPFGEEISPNIQSNPPQCNLRPFHKPASQMFITRQTKSKEQNYQTYKEL